MPNSKTFTIKPIKELIERYIKDRDVIIDPFANDSKYGTMTNELDPEFDTTYHMDALEFLKQIETESVIAFYMIAISSRQVSECYKQFGMTVNMGNHTGFKLGKRRRNC